MGRSQVVIYYTQNYNCLDSISDSVDSITNTKIYSKGDKDI
jgi:hypothetical protein